MNAFEIIGVVTVVWALVLAFLGITREGFPNTDGSARAAIAVSAVLFVACVLSAAITGASEKDDESGGQAAAALRR